MNTFVISHRIMGPYTLIAPDLNAACILMDDLQKDPEVESYKVYTSECVLLHNPSDAFGFGEEKYSKGKQPTVDVVKQVQLINTVHTNAVKSLISQITDGLSRLNRKHTEDLKEIQ